MSRAQEVAELLDAGLTQAQAAARLGISQQRVSALAPRCTTPATAPPVVQPPGAAGVVQPSPVVQPPALDEAAIRADERALLNARIKPHWDAAQAELKTLRARVAELGTGAPGLGTCPAHHVALVAACPRCTPLEDS